MDYADVYWPKRRQRLEKMLQHYQKTGWKTGGFNVHNCEKLRRQIYNEKRKYASDEDAAGNQESVLPALLSWDDEFNDLTRKSDSNIHYYRKYNGKRGVVTLRNRNIIAKPKIDSMDNLSYKPRGGTVKVFDRPIVLPPIKSKVGSLDNIKHRPNGGHVQIPRQQISWNVKSKVGSLDNIDHIPAGGSNPIFHQTQVWNANSKIGSLDNIHHIPKRSFRSYRDSLPPLQRRLLERDGVMWTFGYFQTPVEAETVKRLLHLKAEEESLEHSRLHTH